MKLSVVTYRNTVTASPYSQFVKMQFSSVSCCWLCCDCEKRRRPPIDDIVCCVAAVCKYIRVFDVVRGVHGPIRYFIVSFSTTYVGTIIMITAVSVRLLPQISVVRVGFALHNSPFGFRNRMLLFCGFSYTRHATRHISTYLQSVGEIGEFSENL